MVINLDELHTRKQNNNQIDENLLKSKSQETHHLS